MNESFKPDNKNSLGNVFEFNKSPKKRKKNGGQDGGDGGDMDDILFRIKRLEEQFGNLKEDLKQKPSTEKLEFIASDLKNYFSNELTKIPDENKIKAIISEEIGSKKIVNQDYVSSKVNGAVLKLVLTIVGITVSSIIAVWGILIRLLPSLTSGG